MISYVVFDLDGTLAKIGAPVLQEDLALIHEIEKKGVGIAISSGKPTYYTCGFARQMGLSDPYLIGENGAVLQKGIELPPPLTRKSPIPEKTRRALKELRALLEEKFPDRLWFQPNETALTPFLAHVEDFPALRALFASFVKPDMELTVYEHCDCFDIAWSPLDKGEGIRLLSEVTGADPETMIAVGDWTNDYSMFAEAGFSIGINLPDPEKATVNVPCLRDALKLILEKI